MNRKKKKNILEKEKITTFFIIADCVKKYFIFSTLDLYAALYLPFSKTNTIDITNTNIKMGRSLKVKNIPNAKIIPPIKEYLNLLEKIPCI